MATRPNWTLFCDAAGCDAAHENGARSAKEARLDGRHVGWVVRQTIGGKKLDVCPRCADKTIKAK
jgi:hypothetical protein